ncbi:MAG: WG repeat-containing protein [Lachnospiraceae bacterium]|nr:WG repeat-containing protein [Lachnospiraceae bacterium]
MKKWISIILGCVCAILACACASEKNDEVKFSTEKDLTVEYGDYEVIEEKNIPVEDDVTMKTSSNASCIGEDYTLDNNSCIIPLPRSNNVDLEGWAICIKVDGNFKLSDVQYLNGLDKNGEIVDTHLNYELKDNLLYITPDQYKMEGDSIVIDDEIDVDSSLTSYAKIIHSSDADNLGIIISLKDNEILQAIVYYTYEEVLYTYMPSAKYYADEKHITGCKYGFSEGVCWVETSHDDFNTTSLSLINYNGDILASFDTDNLLEYSNFENGMSIIKREDSSTEMINSEGEVVIAVDALGKVISTQLAEINENVSAELFRGGYILLKKEESSFNSSNTYVALVDGNGNYIIDWADQKDFFPQGCVRFKYMGNDTFAFSSNSHSIIDDKINETVFYNIETKVYSPRVSFYDMHLYSLLTLEDDFDMNSWVIAGDGNKLGSNIYVINTRNGACYNLGSFYDDYLFGKYSDDCFVMIGMDNDHVCRFGIFDTNECVYKDLNFPYLSKIDDVPVLRHTSSTAITRTYSDEVGYFFSDNALLLGMKGEDGLQYFTLINKSGEMVIEPTLGEAEKGLGEGRFLVKIDDKYCVLDNNGKEVFSTVKVNDKELSISSITSYKEGLAHVNLSSGWSGFVDVNGEVVFVGSYVSDVSLKEDNFASGDEEDSILGLFTLKETKISDNTISLLPVYEDVYNAEKGLYEYTINYNKLQGSYILHKISGIIEVEANSEEAIETVSFSAEPTYINKEKIMSYLCQLYGESYEKLERNTLRWSTGIMNIDYSLTEQNLNILWYLKE